jgi:MFS family permease
MHTLLAERNTRWYLAGRMLSTFGDRTFLFAAAIWVRVLSGSNAQAGLTFFFLLAPSLVAAPVAGVIADRCRRRPLLVVANLVTAATLLALLAVHGPGQVWLIDVVMVAYGAEGALLSAASSALLVTVVPGEQLGSANGLLSTVSEGMRLFFPLVGAGLFALAGGHVVALLDAATLVAAVGTLLALRVEEPAPAPRAESWRRVTTAGARHLWQTPALRHLLLWLLPLISTIGFFETGIFALVTDQLHRPATYIGIFVSLQGLGALAGAPTAGSAMRRLGETRLAAAGVALVAAGATLLFAGTRLAGDSALAGIVAGALAIGFGVPWLLVGATTLVQRRSPLALQGRVDAAFGMLFGGLQSSSIALGAGLVAAFGYALPLGILTAGAWVSAAGLLFGEPRPRGAAVGAGSDGITDPATGITEPGEAVNPTCTATPELPPD